MTGLVTWLRAQLDADETAAQDAADGDSGEWFVGDKWNVFRAEDETPEAEEDEHRLVAWGNVKPQSEHIARHDPARVLAEVAAKRLILDIYDAAFSRLWAVAGEAQAVMAECVKLLALPYADEPGYREEWRP